MILRILMIFILLSPCTAYGTSQIPDEMTIDGNTHPVYGLKLSNKMTENFSKHIEEYGQCSANWDGFTATLMVRDKKLFITKIDVGCDFLHNSDYQTPDPEPLFGVSIPESGIFASWFTGRLSEFFGEPFVWHTKSNIRFFHFKKGVLTKIEEIENEQYRKYQNSQKQDSER